MGNSSQKGRHISGEDSGPSLTAGRFIDAPYDADTFSYAYPAQPQAGYQRVNKCHFLLSYMLTYLT